MCQRPYAINLAVPHRQASSPRLLRIIRVNPPMQIVSSLVQRLLTLPHRHPPPPPPHHQPPPPHPPSPTSAHHQHRHPNPHSHHSPPNPNPHRLASHPYNLYLTPSPVPHPFTCSSPLKGLRLPKLEQFTISPNKNCHPDRSGPI